MKCPQDPARCGGCRHNAYTKQADLGLDLTSLKEAGSCRPDVCANGGANVWTGPLWRAFHKGRQRPTKAAEASQSLPTRSPRSDSIRNAVATKSVGCPSLSMKTSHI